MAMAHLKAKYKANSMKSLSETKEPRNFSYLKQGRYKIILK